MALMLCLLQKIWHFCSSKKPRRRRSTSLVLNCLVLIQRKTSSCVYSICSDIKLWHSLEAWVQLSLIFGDLKRLTEQIKPTSINKIKILRFLSCPTPLKHAALAVKLIDSEESVKWDWENDCCHDNRGHIPLVPPISSSPVLPYDSALGRIQLAGTHCGSSCTLLTAVSSWTQESCSSSLMITWSKNCQYWDSIFRAASSISWKSSSWWRKQKVRFQLHFVT